MQNKNPPERTNKPPEPINRTPKSSQIFKRTLQTRELQRHTPGFSSKNRKSAKTSSGACHRSTSRPPKTRPKPSQEDPLTIDNYPVVELIPSAPKSQPIETKAVTEMTRRFFAKIGNSRKSSLWSLHSAMVF